MNYYVLIIGTLLLYMIIWFIVSLILKRNDVADIAWGLGFITLTYLSYYISGFSERGILVAILVTIWGTRLSWHIYLRNRGKGEDYRYQTWRKEWKNFYIRSFFQVYILQGIFLFLISLPILFINHSGLRGITFFDLIGLFIWGIGFYFESLSDSQLKQFILDPSNKGKIMDKGLWQYSRHPNYFGEVTQWWGIFIMVLSIPFGYYTIIGPLTITILIVFVSGVPLLEKKYAGRLDFEEYKKKTSIFFPLPPKK